MNFFINKKILVTGATGFVGSHLTEELMKLGAKVIATTHHPILSNSYFKSQNLDKKTVVEQTELTGFSKVQRLISKTKPDYIFHLAAQPIVDIAYNDPKTTLYANILGTINILECCRLDNHIRGIIVASSDKSYGKLTSKRKYKETDPLVGDHPYEVSKSATDLIANSYFKTYSLPVVVTRFGNIYGEGDIHFSRLVPGLIKAIIGNQTFEIRSNGKYVRDYLYVKDVVKGYLLIAGNFDNVKGEAFNFGSEESLNIIDLINLIEKNLSIKVKYKILNIAKNEIPYQSLDYTKIKNTLDWKPEYELKSTIKKIFEWYKNFFNKSSRI